MKFITKKLDFSIQTIDEMKKNSKKFYDTIRKRRSVRDFKKNNINFEIIKNAILAAGTAPNGANLQPWHFVIIKNKLIKKKIRIAAEQEEQDFYDNKAPKEWIDALKPLGTDKNKSFLEEAPYLIAIFEKKYSLQKTKRIKNYYVKESVGIATGILICCLHFSGLSMLTHTPSPMNFLNQILKRPNNEKPFVLLVVGKPKDDCVIPIFAEKKKALNKITTIF
ncbi:nitroreductase family protein [Alphaproteobacteria bacterium]|nr:nitroreductase family protein [Alphaproteobacteria bacterium]